MARARSTKAVRRPGKYPDDPIVDLGRGRLEIALAQRQRRSPPVSRAELARRATTSPQHLDQLAKGKNRRCRQSLRAKLARVLGCSVAFLAGEADALRPGLAEDHALLRAAWLERMSKESGLPGVSRATLKRLTEAKADELALADVSGGIVLEEIDRLRASAPDLSEWELERRALLAARTRLQRMRRVRVGNSIVLVPRPDDDAGFAVDAEAVSLAREIGAVVGRGNVPADADVLLALQDLLEVRFWRSLLRVGQSDITEEDSAEFADAMANVIRLILRPFVQRKERPTLAALPELLAALNKLRDAVVTAATDGRRAR